MNEKALPLYTIRACVNLKAHHFYKACAIRMWVNVYKYVKLCFYGVHTHMYIQIIGGNVNVYKRTKRTADGETTISIELIKQPSVYRLLTLIKNIEELYNMIR